jgi:hypothetical protein
MLSLTPEHRNLKPSNPITLSTRKIIFYAISFGNHHSCSSRCCKGSLWQHDPAFFRIVMLFIEYCDMSDHTRHQAACFYLNDFGNFFFLFFFLEINKFHFDELMSIKGVFGGCDERIRYPFMSDKHNRFQRMGKASQVFCLKTG